MSAHIAVVYNVTIVWHVCVLKNGVEEGERLVVPSIDDGLCSRSSNLYTQSRCR